MKKNCAVQCLRKSIDRFGHLITKKPALVSLYVQIIISCYHSLVKKNKVYRPITLACLVTNVMFFSFLVFS